MMSWRRGWDSNPRMEVLQTSPLGLLGTAPNARQYIEKQRRMSVGRASTKTKFEVQAPDLCCGCGGDLRFSKKARRFLGRRGTDVKTRSPFESRHFGQLRHDLEVPMIMVVDFLTDRRSVQHEIVCGMIEHRIQPRQGVFEHSCQARVER